MKIKKLTASTKSYTSWHDTLSFELNNSYFELHGCQTGCGLGIISNYSTSISVTKNDHIILLQKLQESIKHKQRLIRGYSKKLDIGRIIFTAGDGYYDCDFVQAAEKLGFTYTTAPNPRHGPIAKQRLYQWILNNNENSETSEKKGVKANGETL